MRRIDIIIVFILLLSGGVIWYFSSPDYLSCKLTQTDEVFTFKYKGDKIISVYLDEKEANAEAMEAAKLIWARYSSNSAKQVKDFFEPNNKCWYHKIRW